MDDRVLRYVDGEFAMTFQHGTRCHSHLRRVTVLRFQCNQTAGYGKPRFAREDDCVYLFDWPNNVTCEGAGRTEVVNGEVTSKTTAEEPEPAPLCQASEVVGEEAIEYNLSPLTKEDGNWEVVTGKGASSYTYVLNVCHKVVATGIAQHCNASSSSCQVESSQAHRAFNMGTFQSAPTVRDGVLTLRYEHGQKCHHAGERATIVRFICAPGATTTSPVFEDELDNCTYTFQWRTAYACPIKKQVVESCVLEDSRTGYTFNMTGLGVHSVVAGGYNYTVAGCGNSVGGGCEDAAVCRSATTAKDKHVKLATSGPILEMEHGDLRSTYMMEAEGCDGGFRKVFLHYRCPPEATKFEQDADDRTIVDGMLQVDETALKKDSKTCLLDVHWYTKRACVFSPDQCVLRDKTTNQVLFDISSLSVGAANASNWKADHTDSGSFFLINICRPLLAVPGCQ